MATITASLFTALDRVVDPGVGNRHFPYFTRRWSNPWRGPTTPTSCCSDASLRQLRWSLARTRGCGRGRRRLRQAAGRMRKIVASRSPRTFSWRNSEQLQGDVVEAVTALKINPAIRRLELSGSVLVVRQLLDANLLDELHLFVHPAAGGSGFKLFEEGGPARHFKLTSAQPFGTGVLYVVYEPDPNPPAGSYAEAKASLPQD